MSPVAVSPYPPAAPVIAGENITVSMFLSNPPYVQRAIRDMTLNRFVADVIFGRGPAAEGGAVIFDQVTENDLYLTRDVEEIKPGMEFPLLTSEVPTPLVAVARKYGGEVFLTDEQIRRNQRNVLGTQMTKLRNTIVRRVDRIAMATLRAAPTLTMSASGDWGTAATDIVRDIATGKNTITRLELGYQPDTMLVHDDQELDLINDKDIRDALPRERNDGLIRTGNVGRLLGLDIIASSQVQPGEVWILERGIIGGISDEVPLYARPIPDERRERVYIHGARVPVAYVNQPKAVIRITGA